MGMLHRPLQIETLKSVHKNGVQYTFLFRMLKIYSTGASSLELKISLTILDASSLSLGEKGVAYLLFHGLLLPWILCPNPKEELG